MTRDELREKAVCYCGKCGSAECGYMWSEIAGHWIEVETPHEVAARLECEVDEELDEEDTR